MTQPAASAKGGNLYIEKLEVPNQGRIGPEGDLDLQFFVKNGANVIAGADPDCCGSYCNPIFGPSTMNGYGYIGYINPEFGEKKSSGKKCIGTTEWNQVRNRITGNWQAPEEPGTYTIEYGITLPGSGQELSSTSQLIVEEGATKTPGNNNGNGEGPFEFVVDTIASNPLKAAGLGAGGYMAAKLGMDILF